MRRRANAANAVPCFPAGTPVRMWAVAFKLVLFWETTTFSPLSTLSRRAFRPARAARVLGRLLADPAVARACAAARARMAGSSDAIIDAFLVAFGDALERARARRQAVPLAEPAYSTLNR